MAALVRLLVSLFRHGGLVLGLAVLQVRRRYVGTVGGIGWSILQPLALVVTYWLVFSLGFKMRIGDGSVSFLVYFITGMAAWFLISEAIAASVSAVSGNAHLIKKVVFPAEVLPVTPILAAMIVHFGLLLIVLVFVLAERGRLPLAALQLPYYALCAAAFCLGLAWLTAAIQVFFRDVQRLVEVVLGVWFWLTPIVWPTDMPGPKWQWLLDLNPAYYVVKGYRDSLVYGVPLWSNGSASLAFWAITLALLVLGAWVFDRLKREFAEVL
jgi:ABC-type polysaccharide/polyol phosphate export permease